MFVGVLRLTLHLPEPGSLKSKRHLVRSAIDRVRARFNVSIAEVAENDLWQRSVLGVAAVGNDQAFVNEALDKVADFVAAMHGGQIQIIGRVAEKYNLYTKITGGQRIDMFGARVDQLPHIWKELIDEGFESGHAYGKSLRTVKSCVGSTWCRFGLHDSVSFAIRIEERYKGLRSPHKLKGGVSGCIRECAEARGKDFGIIATEKGWNLYVCGNGGANPAHAVLLAGDIDSETCIRYLDRFLMYYIKTAGPLVRTSKWLAALDGGILNMAQDNGDQVIKKLLEALGFTDVNLNHAAPAPDQNRGGK